MLHSLSITNFLSFREKQTISFEAANAIKDYEDFHIVSLPDGTRLRKLGIVYGANASGKSNLIEAFSFLRDFWFRIPKSKSEITGIIPFLLDNNSNSHPSDFEIIFYAAMQKYKYTLSINSTEVISERLDYYPGTQPALIFNRTLGDGVSKIKYGSLIKISSAAKDKLELNCLQNMSFIAAYNTVNIDIPEIFNAIVWMENGLLHPVHPSTNLKVYVENMLLKEPDCKSNIVKFLQEADFNINDIMSSEVVETVSDDFVTSLKEQGISQSIIDQVVKDKTIKLPRTDIMHNVKVDDEYKVITLSLEMQSEGTKRMLGLSGAIFKALKNEALLCIDELEAKLHPSMIVYVIENFLRSSNEAQLLLTTHYDNLFDEDDLLRKDNFWFTEKQEDASTALYSLTEFKDLSRISSLQKAYRFGRFGAVPEID